MNLTNNFIYILGGCLFIFVGFKIMYTKTISQGNAGMGGGILHLGTSAYVLGALFVLVGVLSLYSIYRKKL